VFETVKFKLPFPEHVSEVGVTDKLKQYPKQGKHKNNMWNRCFLST